MTLGEFEALFGGDERVLIPAEYRAQIVVDALRRAEEIESAQRNGPAE